MLSIIFVNYKTSQFISECIKSIQFYEKNYIKYEFIVVDNNSNDTGLDELKKNYSFIHIIMAPENGGFAYGNNIGIRASTGDLILLLNPDTYLVDNAIEKLIERIESDNILSFIGPQLIYPDKSNQSYFLPKTYLTLWRHFCDRFFLYRFFPKSRLFNSYYRTYMDYDKECLVEQVSGAAFLFRRDVVGKIGYLDENYFMYFEESDYCLQAIKHGYKMLYYPESKIIHIGGLGSPVNWNRSTESFSNSFKYYFIKNYNYATFLIAAILQVIGSSVRMAAMFLKRDKKYKYHFYFIKNIHWKN